MQQTFTDYLAGLVQDSVGSRPAQRVFYLCVQQRVQQVLQQGVLRAADLPLQRVLQQATLDAPAGLLLHNTLQRFADLAARCSTADAVQNALADAYLQQVLACVKF